MIEVWINVFGYEKSYQISSLGRLKSVCRYRKSKANSYSMVKEKIIKPILLNNGYLKYDLKDHGNNKQFLAHRLVAFHFITNTGLPCVNHINGIKTDNRVENLEWCSYKENIKHAIETGLYHIKQHDFIGRNIKTGEILKFINIQDAANFVNGNRANIHKCLNNKYNRKIAYGHTWEYSSARISQIKSPLSTMNI